MQKKAEHLCPVISDICNKAKGCKMTRLSRLTCVSPPLQGNWSQCRQGYKYAANTNPLNFQCKRHTTKISREVNILTQPYPIEFAELETDTGISDIRWWRLFRSLCVRQAFGVGFICPFLHWHLKTPAFWNSESSACSTENMFKVVFSPSNQRSLKLYHLTNQFLLTTSNQCYFHVPSKVQECDWKIWTKTQLYY